MKRAFVLAAVVLWFACASNLFGSITLTYQWAPHAILEGETSTISLALAFGSADKNPKKIENGLIEGDKTGITLPELSTDRTKSFLAFSANNQDPYSVAATFYYMHPGTAIPRISGTASWKDGSKTKTKTSPFGAELSVEVGQVNPTITLDSVVAVDENELFALHVAATDPGVPVHNFTYAWDLDNDHLFDDATGANVQHSFSHFGVYEVGVRVDDGEGGASEGKVKLTVLEPAPQPPDPGQVPEPASVVIWGVGGLCAAAAACRRRKGKQQSRWSEETRNAIYAVVHARPE